MRNLLILPIIALAFLPLLMGASVPSGAEAIMSLETNQSTTIDLATVNTATFELPVSLWARGNAELAMADARILFDPNVFLVDRIEVNTLIVGIPGVFEMPISQNHSHNNTLGQVNKGFSNVNAMAIFAPNEEYFLGDIIFKLRDDITPGTHSITFDRGAAFTSVNPHADIAIQHDYANGRLALQDLSIEFVGETVVLDDNNYLDLDTFYVTGYEYGSWTGAQTFTIPNTLPYTVANDFVVVAHPQSSYASVDIQGLPPSAGTTNTIEITITAQNGDTRIYTISVTLDAPENPLDSVEVLDITHPDLTITRDGTTNTWNTLAVPFTTTTLTAGDFTFTIPSGGTVTYVQPTINLQSAALPAYSTTPITFTVTSASGNFTATHTINVQRAGGDANTNIIGPYLVIDGTNWNILDEVPLANANAIILNVAPESPLATMAITLNGTAITTGTLTNVLTGSLNAISITITPQFGSPVTRTITFFVRSADLTLTHLTITPTPILPTVFPPAGLLANQHSTPTPISVTLPHGTDSFTIDSAVVNSNEASITSGLGSHNITVLPGEITPITVRVDGEDGTHRNIDLNVTVELAPIDLTVEWNPTVPVADRFFFVGEPYRANSIRLVVLNSNLTTTNVNVTTAMASAAGFPTAGFTTAGQHTLNFEHAGLDASFTIDLVEPTATGINRIAANTTFDQFATYDDRFQIYLTHDFAGANDPSNPITVTIEMLGGAAVFAEAVSIAGARQLTITHQGFTLNVPITVIAETATINGITAQWTSGIAPTFYVGDTFTNGMAQIIHHYTDGSSSAPIPVTSAMAIAAGFDTTTVGTTTLTFTHPNVATPATLTAQVIDAPQVAQIYRITAEWATTRTRHNFIQGEPYQNNSIEIVAHWTDARPPTRIPVTTAMATAAGFDTSTIGTMILNLTHLTFNYPFTIPVIAAQITDIQIMNVGTTTFTRGATYDDTWQLEFIWNWSLTPDTGHPITLAMFGGTFDTNDLGTTTVTVSHLGFTATRQITVIAPSTPTNVTIAVIEAQSQSTWTAGEQFNPTAIVIEVNINDTYIYTTPVTQTMIGTFPTTVGSHTLTINYLGATTTFQITINAAPGAPVVQSISVIAGSRAGWTLGQPYTSGDIRIRALMSDGSSREVDVTLSMINAFPSIVGPATLTITYEGQTTNWNIIILPQDVITNPTEPEDYRSLSDIVVAVAGIIRPWNGQHAFNAGTVPFSLRGMITINAIPYNENATIALTNPIPVLDVGVHTFNIVVTSPAGNTRTYSVIITISPEGENDVDPYRAKLYFLVSTILSGFDWQSAEPENDLDDITSYFRNIYSTETVEPFLEWLGVSIFLLMEWDANGSYSYETTFHALTNSFANLSEFEPKPSPDDDDDGNFFMDNLVWIALGAGVLLAIVVALIATMLIIKKRRRALDNLRSDATAAFNRARTSLTSAGTRAIQSESNPQDAVLEQDAMKLLSEAGEAIGEAEILIEKYTKKRGKK